MIDARNINNSFVSRLKSLKNSSEACADIGSHINVGSSDSSVQMLGTDYRTIVAT